LYPIKLEQNNTI